MAALLDVNLLVAWGWADHTGHRRASQWIGAMKGKRGVLLMTAPIPELGFVRVSVQRTAGRLPVTEASATLAGMLQSLGKRHRFLADDVSANPSHFNGDDRMPVESVSWNRVQEFIAELNSRYPPGHLWKWALPTEAHWERACRGDTSGAYAGNLDKMAWYASNSGGNPHPVGTMPANPFGLNDMHGNVWEWCADWYGAYQDGSATDPVGPASGQDRVFRGGSILTGDWGCRAAYRGRTAPDSRFKDMGFRVAIVPAS